MPKTTEDTQIFFISLEIYLYLSNHCIYNYQFFEKLMMLEMSDRERLNSSLAY